MEGASTKRDPPPHTPPPPSSFPPCRMLLRSPLWLKSCPLWEAHCNPVLAALSLGTMSGHRSRSPRRRPKLWSERVSRCCACGSVSRPGGVRIPVRLLFKSSTCPFSVCSLECGNRFQDHWRSVEVELAEEERRLRRPLPRGRAGASGAAAEAEPGALSAPVAAEAPAAQSAGEQPAPSPQPLAARKFK